MKRRNEKKAGKTSLFRRPKRFTIKERKTKQKIIDTRKGWKHKTERNIKRLNTQSDYSFRTSITERKTWKRINGAIKYWCYFSLRKCNFSIHFKQNSDESSITMRAFFIILHLDEKNKNPWRLFPRKLLYLCCSAKQFHSSSFRVFFYFPRA